MFKNQKCMKYSQSRRGIESHREGELPVGLPTVPEYCFHNVQCAQRQDKLRLTYCCICKYILLPKL